MNLDLATRIGVRTEVFETLAELAREGRWHESAYGPFHTGFLFLKICDRLARAQIIEKRPDGQAFERLKFSYPSVSFPNFSVPDSIASLVRQTLWELCVEGVLAPAPQSRKLLDRDCNEAHLTPLAFYLDLDYVLLTPYGVEVLLESSNRIQVHDPEAYLANFRAASPAPDSVMMHYLGESISVFRGGHFLASVVLLGIASERLIEVMAETLRDALGDPEGTHWFKSSYNRRDISARFNALSGALKREYCEELNREKLLDAFERVVTLSFEQIRLARNDIAHPIGRRFTWNEVSFLLGSFVQYFCYANRIIAFLSSNPKQGKVPSADYSASAGGH